MVRKALILSNNPLEPAGRHTPEHAFVRPYPSAKPQGIGKVLPDYGLFSVAWVWCTMNIHWQSNRDLCQALERPVLAQAVGFAVPNLTAGNPCMRCNIETTKCMIGYAPRGRAAPVLTDTIAQNDRQRERTMPQSRGFGRDDARATLSA
jgi:hypothetical protein